ncbi:hypothetical protein HFP15_32445 [Amycolatopsis sp. K13G38]|uniref:Uncharacterized protein n=1 Tax=Amycolatopsis acididurans TaxID=2724524 RepID=A0ABX1JCR3_9PSEU|nr:hypothetical protein [Amycolatopsis acididurans]NKQ57583.1 hypothetical protein [Amycolatopsis acididurans]
MVTEIHNIIAAATAAYERFAATEPDQETRVTVSNAVKFLVADLTSVAHYATGKD